MNKDCKYSKSPKVQRRLPRPGEQMSAERTLIYGSRRGRNPGFVGHIDACEAGASALIGQATASFTALKSGAETPARVEFWAEDGLPFTTPHLLTPRPFTHHPITRILRKYF